jgi:hypothetical protein
MTLDNYSFQPSMAAPRGLGRREKKCVWRRNNHIIKVGYNRVSTVKIEYMNTHQV